MTIESSTVEGRIERETQHSEVAVMSASSSVQGALSLQQPCQNLFFGATTALPPATPPSSPINSLKQQLNDFQDLSCNSQAPKVATDLEFRDKLVVQYLHLVTPIAAGIRTKLPNQIELDDLVQAGTLGLIDAASKCDPARMAGFPVYARHRIRGAILDSLRHLDHASRELRRRHKQMARATAELTASLNRPPSEVELADCIGVKVERLRKMTLDVQSVQNLSQCDTIESSITLELPCEVTTHPDSIAVRAERRTALRGAIATLPERHQTVMILYHLHELPMAEIAEKLRVDESRISQIRREALKQMGIALRARGISSCACI